MRTSLFFALILVLSKNTHAQYYFQDILSQNQVTEKWKLYRENKVKSVNILSFESDNSPTVNFECSQKVKSDFSQITTYTKSDLARESAITTYYNANGQALKTVDTSKSYQSVTEYQYDPNGNIVMVNNSSTETINNTNTTETHLWNYGPDGMPVSMLKIKNGKDSTIFHFVKDEKGNIAEEHGVHNNINEPVIYYYYDDNGHLTDLVRYNAKAKRLLPDYIFGYNQFGQMNSMIFVQEGTTDYNTWVYSYEQHGLRDSETCFSKQKKLIGKIEYQYSFSK